MATPMGFGKFAAMLFKSQFFSKIPPPTFDFSGQTIIVTGSNTGLGLEAARHLVRLKAAKVILAVRDVTKGQAAAESILKTTGATKDVVEVWPLDLSSYASIKAFAERVKGLDRLDAVLQNAGINTMQWSTKEEDEIVITVNVVGAVLVGLSVLPKLRESAKRYNTEGRLSFVGSDLHYVAKFKEASSQDSLFAALNDKTKVNAMDRYPTSKLLLLYAVREIAARSPVTPDSNVVINCMTPGACKSNLVRDDVGVLGKLVVMMFQTIIARPTDVGGGLLVDAIRPNMDTSLHGAYMQDRKRFPFGPGVESAKGQELARKFNQELFAKLERISPGVTKVLN